jgi:uncharacterized protein (DUF58 family)
MTRSGVVFIVGGLIVYVLGNQTQIGWLYLFDAMIWGVIVVSLMVPLLSIRTLRVTRHVRLPHANGRVHDLASPKEDDDVDVRLEVHNTGRLARYFVKVAEECPLDEPGSEARRFFLPSVGAKGSVAFSYSAGCYKRGVYTAATAVVESAAPFGLFVQKRRFVLPFNVTVYPAYHHIDTVPASRETLAERGVRARSSAATDYYGSREYRAGDPLRHIHWRNSARSTQLVVKQFEETSQSAVAVAFETGRDWAVGKDTPLEYSVKIAASLARYCGDAGRAISVLAGATPVVRGGWMEAMGYLAALTPGDGTPLEALANAAGPSETLVVTTPTSQMAALPLLLRLSEREGRLVVVLLEGFNAGEAPEEFEAALTQANASVVRCAKGHLEAAVHELGNLGLLAE